MKKAANLLVVISVMCTALVLEASHSPSLENSLYKNRHLSAKERKALRNIKVPSKTEVFDILERILVVLEQQEAEIAHLKGQSKGYVSEVKNH